MNKKQENLFETEIKTELSHVTEYRDWYKIQAMKKGDSSLNVYLLSRARDYEQWANTLKYVLRVWEIAKNIKTNKVNQRLDKLFSFLLEESPIWRDVKKEAEELITAEFRNITVEELIKSKKKRHYKNKKRKNK